jgi:hypothetical protein
MISWLRDNVGRNISLESRFLSLPFSGHSFSYFQADLITKPRLACLIRSESRRMESLRQKMNELILNGRS